MAIADLTPEERRQVWELLKRRTGLSDQELREVLEADARERGDDTLARFANPDA
jgi:hypothetical protein